MDPLAKIAPYYKAIVALITPGIVALVTAVSTESPGETRITGPEWLGVIAAMILTGGAVFATPNQDPAGKHQEESVQPVPEPTEEEMAAYADDPDKRADTKGVEPMEDDAYAVKEDGEHPYDGE